MGGADKGLLPALLGFRLTQGETLIQAQLACLGAWACQPIISANRNLDAYAQFGVPVVTDTQSKDAHRSGRPDFGGPLCGIAAAIGYIQTLKLEHEAVLLWWAVDTLISPAHLQVQYQKDLVSLAARARGGAYLQVGAQAQPTTAALHASQWAEIQTQFVAGQRSVYEALSTLGAQPLLVQDLAEHGFSNYNSA